ncbi:MAG: DUF4166 domain-containing protein [Alphaproteobacteria bacterium]
MTEILFRSILGADFDKMPEAVKNMHSLSATRDVYGRSRVLGPKNPISWLIRILARLPKPTQSTPIHIHFIKYDTYEEWDRHFGESRFRTIMKNEGSCLSECLVGAHVTFVYRVVADHKGFSLHTVKVRFLGIPLPRLFWPSLKARAYEWRGRYRFSTMVGFWFCGRVISYFGYLEPAKTDS